MSQAEETAEPPQRYYCYDCSAFVSEDHDDSHDVYDSADLDTGNGTHTPGTEVSDLEERLVDLEAKVDTFLNRFERIEDALIGDRSFNLVEVHDILGELEQLKGAVGRHDELLIGVADVPVEKMSEHQRTTKIRQALVKKAIKNGSQTETYDFTEVASLFDSHISESWASKLLKKAAGDVSDDSGRHVRGFEYVQRPGNARSVLVVDLRETDSQPVSRLHSRSEEGTG